MRKGNICVEGQIQSSLRVLQYCRYGTPKKFNLGTATINRSRKFSFSNSTGRDSYINKCQVERYSKKIGQALTTSRVQVLLQATIAHELICQQSMATVRTVTNQTKQIWRAKTA